MTLRAALQAVSDIVAALPPVGADVDDAKAYRLDDGAPEGAAGKEHGRRAFWFDDIVRIGLRETGLASTQVEYVVPLVVFLRTHSKSPFGRVVLPAEVMSQICRAIERQQTWPAGVNGILLEQGAVQRAPSHEKDTHVVVPLIITVTEE